MVDRFPDGYFWGVIDVKGIVSGSCLCYSTGFWLWTSDSVNFFPFLSPRSHECC
uniref:Uncharacterized protein n=1 Tax=Medicago truncatula TaxID=3880 RepID=I3SU45_MEDTR|nr:unknown [Medicago truncatula]